MKGVILSINPAARIVDLTHAIRPQDVRHASYFLSTAVPYFPAGTIHVCVVDPGVGSERAAIHVECGGQHLVGPDNGVFTGLRRGSTPFVVRRLCERRFWRPTVSDTFHGRDIFAPVAAHLSLGTDPSELGPVLGHPVELPVASPAVLERQCRGEVQFVDEFGNLITNIPASELSSLPVRVSIEGSRREVVRWVRTYSEAPAGELVSLFSSDGFFEIAEVNGNAARRLGVASGSVVELEWE